MPFDLSCLFLILLFLMCQVSGCFFEVLRFPYDGVWGLGSKSLGVNKKLPHAVLTARELGVALAVNQSTTCRWTLNPPSTWQTWFS